MNKFYTILAAAALALSAAAAPATIGSEVVAAPATDNTLIEAHAPNFNPIQANPCEYDEAMNIEYSVNVADYQYGYTVWGGLTYITVDYNNKVNSGDDPKYPYLNGFITTISNFVIEGLDVYGVFDPSVNKLYLIPFMPFVLTKVENGEPVVVELLTCALCQYDTEYETSYYLDDIIVLNYDEASQCFSFDAPSGTELRFMSEYSYHQYTVYKRVHSIRLNAVNSVMTFDSENGSEWCYIRANPSEDGTKIFVENIFGIAGFSNFNLPTAEFELNEDKTEAGVTGAQIFMLRDDGYYEISSLWNDKFSASHNFNTVWFDVIVGKDENDEICTFLKRPEVFIGTNSKVGTIYTEVSIKCPFDIRKFGGAGVTDVEIDLNAPVEYYNLNGVRVNANNLVPGLYIRRQGEKATKIIVK